MSPEEVRAAWEQYRSAVVDEAAATKDSQLVGERLAARFRRLSGEEREMAVSIFCDWLLSDDEAERWDAESLIDDFALVEAVPALRELADRLEVADGPGAPYEWAKVNRLIGQLTGGQEAL